MTTLLFVLLGLLPSFAWLFFFLKEDIHPEPKKMIAKGFFYGIIATVFAVDLQFGFKSILGSLAIGQYDFISFWVFAFIEEVLKFFAAWFAIRKSRFFDEPVDAMIYIIVASLGFALVENVAVVGGAQAASEAVSAVTLRFVGATLLHALSSAIVGYYWAKSMGLNLKTEQARRWAVGAPPQINMPVLVIEGLFIASTLHAIFNYLIITLKDVLVYPTIFLVLISLFVFWDFERVKSPRINLE